VGDDLGVSLKLLTSFECAVDLLCVLCYPSSSDAFLAPHRDELSMLPSNFGFRRAPDWLFFPAVVIHLMCFLFISL
jgi:hypothetical protein